MEPQAALVRAQGRVELDAVPAVHLQVAGVILPDDAELDDSFGDRDHLESGPVFGVFLKQCAVLERADKF